MSATNLDSLKFSLHKRVQSQLPILSLSELQKNFLALKGKNKNNNRNSLSNFHIRQSNNDILIKSPFYDRANCSNKKGGCKCQFHKRQKLFVQKLFPFEKKPKVLKQLNLDRMKTLGKESPVNQKKFQKNASMQRISTRVTLTEQKGTPNQKFQKIKRLIEQNKEQYFEYLKLMKEKSTAEVDCRNLQFEQFLKTNRPWILRQSKQKKTFLKSNHNQNGKMVSVSNSRHHLRFKTVPSDYDDQDQNDEKNKQNKPSRKNDRKFTEIAGQSGDSFSFTHKKSNSNLLNSFEKLKPEERSKLQEFYRISCQQIGLNYSELKNQPLENIPFFETLCKKISDSQPTMVENAKKVLKRISKLPLNLYSTVLREIKNEIQSKSSKSVSQEAQNKQNSISIAFDTIQSSIGDLVKNRYQFKGKEKLTLLGKLKSMYVGRSFRTDSKTKHRYSNNSLDLKRFATSKQKDSKKSRYVNQKQEKKIQQEVQKGQNPNQTYNFSKITLERRPSQEDEEDYTFQQKHQLKKHKMKRQKKDNNIMKMIDEEIQHQLNTKSEITKELNSKVSGQYEKQIARSRKKHRDEEFRKHLQFMAKMQQRANEKQLTIREQEINNNSVNADYLKNKIFTRKVERYLDVNSDLKQMIINERDDLLTKKRKIRILNKMIDQLMIEKPYSQFYKDMKRYVQIFQQICNLPGKEKKDKHYKKLKRNKSLAHDDLYEEDFRTKQQTERPFSMEQFVNSINLEGNQLRYYKIGTIQLEEEDLDEIIKEFLSRPMQQKKPLVKKVVYLNEQIEQTTSVQRKILDEDLVQVDLDNDTQKVSMEKFYYTETGQSSRFCSEIQQQSKEIKRIKNRFRKNMEKYQKVFNTITTFTTI